MDKSNSKVETHKESGLDYYKIKLVGEGEDALYLRLFESTKPHRLKWENDEETHDEYLVRRKYMKQLEKNRKKGVKVWDSAKWGIINQMNALRVQSELQAGKNPNEIIKI
jgi:hypothetical protein